MSMMINFLLTKELTEEELLFSPVKDRILFFYWTGTQCNSIRLSDDMFSLPSSKYVLLWMCSLIYVGITDSELVVLMESPNT